LLQKIWRLCIDEESGELVFADSADEATEKQLHRMIAKVGDDIEKLSFNTAIAAVFEFVNVAKSLTQSQMERFVKVIAPFTPHVAEELWHKLGHEDSVATADWPSYDEAMLVDDEIEIPIQVMGKLRSKIYAAPDTDAKTLEEMALADEKIQGLIEGKTVRKVVVVPGRLVNIVAN
ncbi:MAG: class I tRNA ligase family protein, partial [Phycisphaerales bacterium]